MSPVTGTANEKHVDEDGSTNLDASSDFVLVDKNEIQESEDVDLIFEPPETIAKIKQWLKPTDYLGEASEYKKHLNSHIGGTGLWILNTNDYTQWRDSPNHGSLWIKAVAGAGKSVLAASIVSQFSRMEEVPVLFFFFRQIVANNHSPHFLVRDWIAQVLSHSPVLQRTMKHFMEKGDNVESIPVDSLWNDLVTALRLIPKVYCIADALDEMDTDEVGFLKSLVNLGQQKPSSIKLLMTSRPLPYLQKALTNKSTLQIRLEERFVDEDIAKYVDHKLDQANGLESETRIAIGKSIKTRAQGSFLFARLVLDEFLDKLQYRTVDLAMVEESMNKLSGRLEDVYNTMLLGHSKRSHVPEGLQKTIIQLVTHASRPLRLLEISDALHMLHGEALEGQDIKAKVRLSCGNLLEILEDETVSVIHHSFTEFMLDTGRALSSNGQKGYQFPVISSKETHRLLARLCLGYLNSCYFTDWQVPRRQIGSSFYHEGLAEIIQRQQLNDHFLSYAAKNWYIHLQHLDEIEPEFCILLDELISADNHAFNVWVHLEWQHHRSPKSLTPLHVAAWTGTISYARYIIQKNPVYDEGDKKEETPLILASMQGHTKIVALLLENGADIEATSATHTTPLYHATKFNHPQVVRFLLESGANPILNPAEKAGIRQSRLDSMNSSTPLGVACSFGCLESLQEMMPYLEQDQLQRAFEYATRLGKDNLVELLLTSPLVVVDKMSDVYNCTPLFLAARRLRPSIMKTLIKRGADPKRRTYGRFIEATHIAHKRRGSTADAIEGPTLLHAIAGLTTTYRRENINSDDLRACFDVLAQAGCEVNAINEIQMTPLHFSVINDRLEITRLLLENGADPMAKDKKGNMPLHYLKNTRHLNDTIKVFLKHSVALDILRPGYGSIPHLVIEKGADLTILMPYISNWDMTDSKGNTILHTILSRHHDNAMVVKLLELGADPGKRNKTGDTPLHILVSAFYCSEDVLSELVSKGADLEARDRLGRTVLLRALEIPLSPAMIKLLIRLGAKLDVQDFCGNGILHLLCSRWRQSNGMEYLQLFLDAGADPLLANHAGEIPVHALTKGCSWRGVDQELHNMLLLLMTNGNKLNARNHKGQTILHLLCRMSCDYVPLGLDLDLLTIKEIMAEVDTEDYDGIRPIHLAATISEVLVERLIHMGADTLARTYEGRSALHIAALARLPNVVGLLLEHYSSMGQIDMVQSKDERGRTPLHEACRSGRADTVKLLLKAGANPNSEDSARLTPLHACAEFTEERLLWELKTTPEEEIKALVPAGILPSDLSRPKIPTKGWSFEGDPENRYKDFHMGSVRTREIIRLLELYGADIAKHGDSAMSLAVAKGCKEAIIELKLCQERVPNNTTEDQKSVFNIKEMYLALAHNHVLDALDNSGHGKYYESMCNELLKFEEYEAIEHLAKTAIDFTPSQTSNIHYQDSFLGKLVIWGYTSVFDAIGSTIQKPSWIDGQQGNWTKLRTISPWILTAASSKWPNLDMIKLMVEKFKADINIQPPSTAYRGGGHGQPPRPSDSLLHNLSRGQCWWHMEAISYVLSRGANLESRNLSYETPLHLAVKQSISGCYRRLKTTKILLERGANCNVIDERGRTPLSYATCDLELVKLLMAYGADPYLGKKPVLLSAISQLDTKLLKHLIDEGVEVNARDCSRLLDLDEKAVESDCSHSATNTSRTDNMSPIWYAASSEFNTIESQAKAIQITKVLLESNADFYQEHSDTLVLHHLFESGGLLQPFLELENLDLEHRDAKGRTLLLAACQCSHSTYIPLPPINSSKKYDPPHDRTRAMTIFHKGANLMAIDYSGNNALHLLVAVSPQFEEEHKQTLAEFIGKAPSLVGQKNQDGCTPFHAAIQVPQPWSFQLLLDAGANPFEQDPNGRNVLHYLASTILSKPENVPYFKQFLALNVDINTKDIQGETAIFKYITSPIPTGHHVNKDLNSQYRLYSDLFVNAGADVHAINDQGETLLHVVAKTKCSKYEPKKNGITALVDTFKCVMELGVDPLIEDKKQRTALDIATAYGNEDILALFKRENTIAVNSEH